MPYLIFSGMDYEAQGGMGDLHTVARTKEALLSWAQTNLPPSSNHWVDILEVTEDEYYAIDEDELSKGRIIRYGKRL